MATDQGSARRGRRMPSQPPHPMSNDPIVDPPSEVVYLRDDKSGEFWTATPAPAAGAVTTLAKFGQGYANVHASSFRARRRAHDFCAGGRTPIKLLRLRIRNGTSTPRDLSAFHYVEWCLGDTRSRSAAHIVTTIDTVCGALFARNPFRAAFGRRVAFMDVVSQSRSMTGDRTSFVGRNGNLSDPFAMEFVHLPGRVGPTSIRAARKTECHAAEVRRRDFPLGKAQTRAASALVGGTTPRAVDTALAGWISGTGESLHRGRDADCGAGYSHNDGWVSDVSCRCQGRSAFSHGWRFDSRHCRTHGLLLRCRHRAHSYRGAAGRHSRRRVQHCGTSGREGVRTASKTMSLMVYATRRFRVTCDVAFRLELANLTAVAGPTSTDLRNAGASKRGVPLRPLHAATRGPCSRRTDCHHGHGDWNTVWNERARVGRECLARGSRTLIGRGELATPAEINSKPETGARRASQEGAQRGGDGNVTPRVLRGRQPSARATPECRSDANRAERPSYRDRRFHARVNEASPRVLIDRDNRRFCCGRRIDRADRIPAYQGYVLVCADGGSNTSDLWVVMAQAFQRRGDEAHEL